MTLRRFAVALAGIAVAAAAGAVPAEAKEDVRATLTTTIPVDASAGTEIRVAWRLFYVGEEGKRRPFGANGVFVRLLSASGRDATEGFAPTGAYPTGEYEATVVVPGGGIGDVEIGLMGWQSDAAGTRRADALFPITNEPLLTGAVASVPANEPSPSPASATGSSSRTVVLLTGGAAAFAALAFALVLRRRRSTIERGL
jgi:hypothetical protein